MIKNINIRFNLDKEEHKNMQKMDRLVEKSYSKIIIKSLIWYFENADAKDGAEMSENYWKRFRSEIRNLLREQGVLFPVKTELPLRELSNKKLAEKEVNYLPEIREDVLDALEDLF